MSTEAPAREDAAPKAAPSRLPPLEAIDRWEDAKRQLVALLRVPEPDADWLQRVRALPALLRALIAQDVDAALYLLVQMSSSDLDRYSAHHALLCAVVAELCAEWLEWPEAEREALFGAALTMNVSMSAMQDALARQATPLSEAQREEVRSHPARSVQMLVKAGVEDPLWLAVVGHHHVVPAHDAAERDLPPAQRLAMLLHRVDVYTAKLSRRASREATSPAIAARDACLDTRGVPDAIGATMLRVLGLYPPGTFVMLRNREMGVVIRRGAKAHTPLVAVIRRSDGGLNMHPVRRETLAHANGVVRGVGVNEVKVRLHHERVLGSA
jgi:hypothetical protein